MTISPRNLAQMQNRPTSYEIVFSVNGSTTRFPFSERVTEKSLLSALRNNMNDDLESKALAAMTERERSSDYKYNSFLGRIELGASVWVGKTGLTERDLAES